MAHAGVSMKEGPVVALTMDLEETEKAGQIVPEITTNYCSDPKSRLDLVLNKGKVLYMKQYGDVDFIGKVCETDRSAT